MEFEKLKREAITLEKAIFNIKNNKSNSYEWYSVKNEKECLIEVGGRNNEKLEIKAYIPKFENGKYVIHTNDFVNSEYSIDLDGYLEFPRFRVSVNKNWNLNEMIKFLNNTNFKTYIPKIKSYQKVKEYETIYEIDKL